MFDKIQVEISVDEDKHELRILCIDPPVHTPVKGTPMAAVQTEPIVQLKKKRGEKRKSGADNELEFIPIVDSKPSPTQQKSKRHKKG